MLAFGAALLALVPSLARSLDAIHGTGQPVLYTFDEYTCVGPPAQLKTCRWVGTIEADFGALVVGGVSYLDDPPDGVEPGMTTPALWSPDEPNSAINLEESHVWREILASTAAAALGLVVFFALSILWWRRVARADKVVGADKVEPKKKSVTDRRDDPVQVVNS